MTLDRDPAARRRPALELDDAAGEGARAGDARRQQAGRGPAERHRRPDADGRRRAHAAVPARPVRGADRRPRQVAPRPVGGGQDGRDRPERAVAEGLREHRHDLAGPPGRDRARERDPAAVDDPERRSCERHADRRERDVGAAARSRVARRDEPVVVGRARREARERRADAPRARARAGASPRRPRPVARGGPVLQVPASSPAPCGSTEPTAVAVVAPTACAAPVTAAGASDVVKLRSPPTVVPDAFVATRR